MVAAIKANSRIDTPEGPVSLSNKVGGQSKFLIKHGWRGIYPIKYHQDLLVQDDI